MEIKSVEKLVSSLVGNDKEFISSECKYLLAHGENYGSVMLDLKVTLKNKDNKEEIIDCIAKTCPPKGLLWKIFNVPLTTKKEIEFYRTVVPTLNNFGKEKGIEVVMPFFAKFYGGRISLDPTSDIVDTDAVLLLENIKPRGFRLGDRFVGFDINETKLILKDMAVFHAVPLAHKLQKPEEFKEKVRPYLNQDLKFEPPPDMIENITSILRGIASTASTLATVYPKIEANFERYCKQIIVNPPKIREPFATMVHNDLWVNNTMIRYENGSPIENIIVDFQGVDYNSPTHDVLFFLYTSVELSLVEHNFDNLVQYYFNIFIATLRRLGCETEQFTFQTFMEEMGEVANENQFFHLMMMMLPIYTKKEEAKDLSKIQDVITSTSENTLHENFHMKAVFILSDFVRRGWL